MANETSHDQLTVVIAGASSGFGKGVARRLAADGANLVLGARRTQLVEALAEELSPNAVAVSMDISKEEDVKKLYDTAMENSGGLMSGSIWPASV